MSYPTTPLPIEAAARGNTAARRLICGATLEEVWTCK